MRSICKSPGLWTQLNSKCHMLILQIMKYFLLNSLNDRIMCMDFIHSMLVAVEKGKQFIILVSYI